VDAGAGHRSQDRRGGSGLPLRYAGGARCLVDVVVWLGVGMVALTLGAALLAVTLEGR
jgi:hypothetical protein